MRFNQIKIGQTFDFVHTDGGISQPFIKVSRYQCKGKNQQLFSVDKRLEVCEVDSYKGEIFIHQEAKRNVR